MHNFWKGLLFGLIGSILWLITSVILGFGEAISELPTSTAGKPPFILEFLMYIGGSIIILAPFIFWIVLPIRNMIRKKYNYFIKRWKKKSK